jgi:hypothetical protein
MTEWHLEHMTSLLPWTTTGSVKNGQLQEGQRDGESSFASDGLGVLGSLSFREA